jgi:sigma-B regulation protein RsbU (phosphoserine phosphatase)
MDRVLDEQLSKLKTDRIDYYLIHGVNGELWENAKENGVIEFLGDALKKGKIVNAGFSFHGLAFSLGFTEILFHQIGAVYFIGWASGMQYWLIYLAGLTFFNEHWKKSVHIGLITIISFTYVILYLFFRTSAVYALSEPIYDFLYLNSILTTILSLVLLINYYVKAANTAENNLKSANQQLSEKNTQIEQALHDRNQALEQLNQELAEAAEYVRSILPPPLTEGDIQTDWRYIPSTSLGGDAFGYHMVDEDHFAIYLIDVSGHGVGAALLSVSVMNVLRSQSLPATDFKDPEQVLAGKYRTGKFS